VNDDDPAVVHYLAAGDTPIAGMQAVTPLVAVALPPISMSMRSPECSGSLATLCANVTGDQRENRPYLR